MNPISCWATTIMWVYVPDDRNPEPLLQYQTFHESYNFLSQNALWQLHDEMIVHVWYSSEKQGEDSGIHISRIFQLQACSVLKRNFKTYECKQFTKMRQMHPNSLEHFQHLLWSGWSVHCWPMAFSIVLWVWMHTVKVEMRRACSSCWTDEMISAYS